MNAHINERTYERSIKKVEVTTLTSVNSNPEL